MPRLVKLQNDIYPILDHWRDGRDRPWNISEYSHIYRRKNGAADHSYKETSNHKDFLKNNDKKNLNKIKKLFKIARLSILSLIIILFKFNIILSYLNYYYGS